MFRKYDSCFSLILTEGEQCVGVGGDKTEQ